MYRAGMASILSQLAREDRLRVVDDVRARRAEDQAARAEDQGAWASTAVLVITDELDENLLPVLAQPAERAGASSRATPTRCRLVRFKNVLVTKARGGASSRRCWHE